MYTVSVKKYEVYILVKCITYSLRWLKKGTKKK